MTSSNPARPDPTRIMLILDDEPEIAEFVALAAHGMGFQTMIASDAEAFLRAATSGVTHIVLDLFMPGMDGVEVIRELSRRGCRARLVLISGFDAHVLGMAEELARNQGLDVLGQLPKPIRLRDLENLLEKRTDTAQDDPSGGGVGEALTRSDLDIALAADQFFLAYQPQIEIASNRIVGMEALVRWMRPHGGIVQPGQFINAFESLGMANELTSMVLGKGSKALRDNERLGALNLGINISAESLMDLSMPERFVSALAEHGVSPARIVLEITESRMAKDLARSMDILMRFRFKGFQISIDDFGTGYAMMEQLRHVPANEIKIDSCFTRDVLTHKSAKVVVEKTIEIGHELGMRVVAEGVEEPAQLEFLRDRGCDVAQGYLFGRPADIEEIKRQVSAPQNRSL